MLVGSAVAVGTSVQMALAATVPPATVETLTALWTWDGAAVLALVLAAGYFVGLRRVRVQGLSWPVGRVVAFATGTGSLVLITCGGIGRYAHVSVTSPLLGPLVVPVVLAVVSFTPVLRISLSHSWAFALLHVALVAVGLTIAIGFVGDGIDREGSLALAAADAVGLAEFLLDAVPGIVVRLRTHLLAPEYWAIPHRSWGPSPLADQQHAGAVWFVAEAADLPFLVILARRWVRADAREATHIDYELDHQPLPRPPLSPPGAEPTDRGPGLQRPWWETDQSRLAGHRLAREYGGAVNQPTPGPAHKPGTDGAPSANG